MRTKIERNLKYEDQNGIFTKKKKTIFTIIVQKLNELIN